MISFRQNNLSYTCTPLPEPKNPTTKANWIKELLKENPLENESEKTAAA